MKIKKVDESKYCDTKEKYVGLSKEQYYIFKNVFLCNKMLYSVKLLIEIKNLRPYNLLKFDGI